MPGGVAVHDPPLIKKVIVELVPHIDLELEKLTLQLHPLQSNPGQLLDGRDTEL
jgi:hypothetical protein